jgi:DNA-directed RNA polymerase subunit M/transcription elongation factor TFIIS
MEIDTDSRNENIKKLTKIFKDKTQLVKDIENSIYKFSKDYAETNDTPFLIQSIYDSKSEEILSLLLNCENTYLVNSLNENKIDAKKIAFMKPEELNPEKYESIIKKREMEEYKKNNASGTSAFTCSKCKKARCKVSQKQTRAGDEPPTTFVSCLECGHTFKFN